ncbi:MAG: hypothetical protein IT379_39435 [Deltaproteobacteria bacterium]|nr:hypothetical protein [Deltaproteobacteria bacterium]
MTASLIDVAKGSVIGHRTVTIVGRRTDLSTSEHDVWTGGESGGTTTRAVPSSAGAMSIVSSSADDAAAGTGARSVEIDYLDGDYLEQTKVVALAGATPVVTTELGLRVQRVRVKEAGSGEVNAGAISVSIGGSLQAHIPAGLGESPQALWTVPAGYQALLLREWIESSSAATGRLYRRASGATSARQMRREHRTTSPHGGSNARALEAFTQKTDIMFRAISDGGAAHVVAGVELLLVAL